VAHLSLRAEEPADRDAIAAVTAAAFGKQREARMVDAIRSSDAFVPELSLVAELAGEIVGHLMLSYVGLEGSARRRARAPGPRRLPARVFVRLERQAPPLRSFPVAGDRWWRGLGFDAVVLNAVPAGSRVLEVGCGDGSLVDHLTANGLDAVGVDPNAPEHPRLIRAPVEHVTSIGRFDVVCAVMALHHADLGPVLAAIVRLLHPGGRLLACEFAWEKYDERAASWVTAYDDSEADTSVEGWQLEHADLHTGSTIRSALDETFASRGETEGPYLACMLGKQELEREERTLIAAGELPALGWRFSAEVS
jgi:SAM-dependent methyltransferase